MPTRCHCERASSRLTAPADRSPAISTRVTWFLSSSGRSKVASARVSPSPSVKAVSPSRWPRADTACSTPARDPPSARSTCASRLAPRQRCRPRWRAPRRPGACRRPRSRRPPAPAAARQSAASGRRGRCRRRARPPSRSCPAASWPAPRRPPCGPARTAAAAARWPSSGPASGASIFRLVPRVAVAVGTIITGRLCPSASAISRSIRNVRADHCAAADQPLSTTSTTGPEPPSALSRFGLSTGSASARMTSAAASMRISVSHQGVCAGVFSRFSRPTRMRVGGNARRRGCGGTVRSSHQMTGSARAPASSHGLRNAIGPSVIAAPSARPTLGLPAIVAGQALQPHGERQQRLGRRPVGVMHQERPADPAGRLARSRRDARRASSGRPGARSRRDRRPSARRLPARGTPCGPRRPASLRPDRGPGSRWPLTPPSASSLMRWAMACGGSRKSLNSNAVENRLSRAGGGRLACRAGSNSCVASASAMRALALRLASGGVTPIRAMRSPARTSSSAKASVSTTARSRLAVCAR